MSEEALNRPCTTSQMPVSTNRKTLTFGAHVRREETVFTGCLCPDLQSILCLHPKSENDQLWIEHQCHFWFYHYLVGCLGETKTIPHCCGFDHKSENIRKQEYELYKANRDETPEDIVRSEPYIRQIIDAFNIPILEKEGYEADDVIVTLAKKAEQNGFKTYMMTPDKDFGQAVTENVLMYKPGRGGKPAEIWGPEEVCARFGLERTEQVIDLLGLMGRCR